LIFFSSDAITTALTENEKHKRSSQPNSILFDEDRVIKEHHEEDDDSDAKHFSSSGRIGVSTTPSSKNKNETKSSKDSEPQLLHSGPVLGQLPLLQSGGSGASPISKHSHATNSTPASSKKKKQSGAPNDLPKEFLCELCQRQLTDPVKSVYGNIYEKSVIEEWLKNQGKICPLTGAPLSEADLVPQDELKMKIRKWILQKSISTDDPSNASTTSPTSQSKSKTSPTKHSGASGVRDANDDLYDF
jgi:hypothetical protein